MRENVAEKTYVRERQAQIIRLGYHVVYIRTPLILWLEDVCAV